MKLDGTLRAHTWPLAAMLAIVMVMGWHAPGAAQIRHAAGAAMEQTPAIGGLPLTVRTAATLEFEQNQGQLHGPHGAPLPAVLYRSQYDGLTAYYERNAIHFYFTHARNAPGPFVRPVSFPDRGRSGEGVPTAGLRPGIPSALDPNSKLPDLLHSSLVVSRIDLTFVGADPAAKVSGEDPTGVPANYYTAGVSSGLLDVPSYRRLVYHDLYPDIDMIVYAAPDGSGTGGAEANDMDGAGANGMGGAGASGMGGAGASGMGGMKYDFIVRPGGDPAMVHLRYDGADSLRQSADGAVRIYCAMGSICEEPPVSYQSSDTSRVAVASRYLLDGKDVRLAVGSYDRSRPLVIDPPRVWATYFGGASYDALYGVCTDRSDNIFVTGMSYSNGLGTSGVHQDTLDHVSGYIEDGIVAKFSPAGARVWTTYYGGGLTYGYRIALDRSANVIIVGETYDDSAIASPGAFQTLHTDTTGTFGLDAFLAKFDSSGHRWWGTFYGSSAYEVAYAVAVDSSDNIYFGGYTTSSTGLATAGAFKTSRSTYSSGDVGGFAAKFSPSGSRLWGTYFGDTGTYILGMDIAAPDTLLLCGETFSRAGIATSGSFIPNITVTVYAGFVQKFTGAGGRVWGTYIDGTTAYASTGDWAVRASPTGNVLTGGITSCNTSMATTGAYRMSVTYGMYGTFFWILDARGYQTFGTYFSNSPREYVADMALAPDGGACMAGWTADSFHVATAGAYQSVMNDSLIGFAAKFARDGALQWGTYYSGNGHPDGTTLIYGAAVDHRGHPVLVGPTGSSTGISSAGAWQSAYGGSPGNSYAGDGFIVKLCDTLRVLLHASSGPVICSGENDTLFAPSGYGAYQWHVNGAAISGATAHSYVLPLTISGGTYHYTVDLVDASICSYRSDTLTVTVRPKPIVSAGTDHAGCLGSAWVIGAPTTGTSGPYTYAWSPGTGLSDSTIARPTAAPRTTTTYVLTVTDINGCSARDTALVTVYVPPHIPAVSQLHLCTGESTPIGAAADSGMPPYQYQWDPPTALTATNIPQPIATPTTSTEYHVHVTDANGCETRDTIHIVVDTPPVRGLLPSGAAMLCAGDTLTLTAPPGLFSYQWFTGERTPAIAVTKAGVYSAYLMNAAGCGSQSDSTTVVLTPAPTTTITGAASVCLESIEDYSTPPDPLRRYRWSVDGGNTIIGRADSNAIDIHWSQLGTWGLTLHLTDGTTGCSRDTLFTVTVGSSITPVITPAGPVTLCQGDTVTLSAPGGYASYRWTSGDTTPTVRVASSGSYSVTVVSASGCSGVSLPVVVHAVNGPPPAPRLTSIPAVLCQGDSSLLGTTAPFAHYLWSTGDTTASIMIYAPGLYSVLVANASGCTGTSDSVSVQFVPIPAVQLTSAVVVSCGDSIVLRALATPGLGLHYQWLRGAALLSDTTPTLAAIMSGSYTVTVTNAAGCSVSSNAVLLTISPSPHPVITGPISACPNSRTYYSTLPRDGTVFSWICGGGNFSGASINDDSVLVQWGAPGAGTSVLIETDTTTGCTGTDSISITIDNTLAPKVTPAGPLVLCAGDSVLLDAGAGYTTYQWQQDGADLPGDTARTLLVGVAGSYVVLVSNGASCSGASKAVVIAVHALPPQPVITRSGDSLIASAAFFRYQWYVRDTLRSLDTALPGQTAATIVPSAPGRYSVLVADTNGCTGRSLPFDYENSGMAMVSLGAVPVLRGGDTVDVPLVLDTSYDLFQTSSSTFSAMLHWRGAGLRPRAPGGTLTGNTWNITVTGMIDTPKGVMANFTLEAVDSSTACTDLVLDTVLWQKPNVTTAHSGGLVCVAGACSPIVGGPDTALFISSIVPNPSRDGFTIDYHLAADGPMELFAEDVMGRTAALFRRETSRSAGDYHERYSVAALPSGVYRLVLRSGRRVLDAMLEVVR